MSENLTNIEAATLEGCSVKEFLTFFTEKPTKKAIKVNDILRERNLQELKNLMLRRIQISASIIEKYTPSKMAKMMNLDAEINQISGGMGAATLEEYNNFVVLVFRAADQNIDKSISMLDFCNLENQVREEAKKREQEINKSRFKN